MLHPEDTLNGMWGGLKNFGNGLIGNNGAEGFGRSTGKVLIAAASYGAGGAGEVAEAIAAPEAVSASEIRLANMARGRAAHVEWQQTLGPEWETEYTINGYGRADAVMIDEENGIGRVFELKPNNPAAIARGSAQLEKYLFGLSERFPHLEWSGGVVTY